MLNSQTGYAGSQGGLIYATQDGGQNWDFYGVAGGPVRDMYFPPNSDTGLVCCDQTSKYYVIKPEGVESRNLPSPNFWTGISATTDGVWICGGTSIILIKDGLYNWQSASNNGYWTSIFFINENYGWAGNSGLINGFIDPDIPWSIVLDTDDTHSYCIHAIDEDHVWAVLLDGRIMHTDNGSEYGFDTITSYMWSDVEWETQPHPHPNSGLLAIQFNSLNNGYAVGHNNVILKYTEVSAIGEQQFNEFEFEVCPIPCQDEITIRLSAPGTRNSKLEIIGVSGKVVYKKDCGSDGLQEFRVDVSHLPAGLYLVKLQTEEALGIRKIIIQ